MINYQYFSIILNLMIYHAKPLGERRLKAAIRERWNNNTVIIWQHARKRMAERNITVQDMKNILWHGQLVDRSMPEGTWRYKIEGHTLNNKQGSCVVEIEDALIIVTVIG